MLMGAAVAVGCAGGEGVGEWGFWSSGVFVAATTTAAASGPGDVSIRWFGDGWQWRRCPLRLGAGGEASGAAKCTLGDGVGVSTTPAPSERNGVSALGGGSGVDGAGMSVMALVHRPVSNSVRFFRVATWLSVTGANGEPGDGCRRAVAMSCTAGRRE
jgi:hypothetical protein